MKDKKSQKLEAVVNDISNNPWYKEEVDKLLSGVVISGLVGGALVAMYGHNIDKDLIKGLGYGILYGDALVCLSIFAEGYLRNRFNRVLGQRAQ